MAQIQRRRAVTVDAGDPRLEGHAEHAEVGHRGQRLAEEGEGLAAGEARQVVAEEILVGAGAEQEQGEQGVEAGEQHGPGGGGPTDRPGRYLDR